MRRHNCLAIAALLLGGIAATPVSGEQIEYYVWTDENGVIHAEGTPPEDRDYEIRIIELEENVIPSPEPASPDEDTATSADGEAADSGSDAPDSDSETDDSAPPVPPFEPGVLGIPEVFGP